MLIEGNLGNAYRRKSLKCLLEVILEMFIFLHLLCRRVCNVYANTIILFTLGE